MGRIYEVLSGDPLAPVRYSYGISMSARREKRKALGTAEGMPHHWGKKNPAVMSR